MNWYNCRPSNQLDVAHWFIVVKLRGKMVSPNTEEVIAIEKIVPQNEQQKATCLIILGKPPQKSSGIFRISQVIWEYSPRVLLHHSLKLNVPPNNYSIIEYNVAVICVLVSLLH